MSRQILEAELTETGGEPTFRVSFQLTPPDRAREEGVGSSSGWWHHPTEGGCRPPTSAGEQAGRLVISDDLGSVHTKKSGWSCDSCVVGPQWIPANGEGGGWRSTSFVEATCDLNVTVALPQVSPRFVRHVCNSSFWRTVTGRFSVDVVPRATRSLWDPSGGTRDGEVVGSLPEGQRQLSD